MNKPWKSEPRGSQLEAFVGAFGIHTSQFKTPQELVWFACRLFEIEPDPLKTVEEAATMIEAIGKKERSVRAKRNRDVLFPNESFEKRGPGAPETPITPEALQRMMDASTPKLIDGAGMDIDGMLDVDPAQLLRKVVSAVISAGRSDILWEYPEVLAFFNARIPDRAELAGHHNVDERMFEAKAKWPNVKPPGRGGEGPS
jgi:hypothetical protein